MNRFKLPWLTAVTLALLFTVGKSTLQPVAQQPTLPTFTFPDTAPLPQWQLVESGPVNAQLVQPPAYIDGHFIAGKHYRYRQRRSPNTSPSAFLKPPPGTSPGNPLETTEEILLEIEIRYLANTNGDLKSFITHKTGNLLSALKRDPERGFYSLFTHEDNAYLSTCLNADGGSTVTSDQFGRNRKLHDSRPARVIDWLKGENTLPDERCLWAHFSVPLASYHSTDEAYEALKTAWTDWFDWWQPRFPEDV